MNFILLHRQFGSSSMRKAAEKMTQPIVLLGKTKNETWTAFDKTEGGWLPTTAETVFDILHDESNRIINWGNHIFADNNLFDLNVPSAVYRAGNKRLARKLMQSKGVPVPYTWFWESEYDESIFPCIARPSKHFAGKHFHILNNWDEFHALEKEGNYLADWYFSAIFEKTHEFRVHVAHGKVLVTHEKPLVPGELRANHAVNHEQWRALKWSEFVEDVSLAALMATDTVELDYAAVDVMYNSQNGLVAVAEVNTSPEICADYTSGKYAAYFDWVIRHDFPEHFKPSGTSVFYNNILRD